MSPRKHARRRKASKKVPAVTRDLEAQRQELFAIVAVAACLAQVVDDEFAPAADLIARIADGVADALAGLAGGGA